MRYEIILRFILVLAGLNYIFMDNITFFTYSIPKIIGYYIGIIALLMAFKRDYYLPFLGPCILPFNTERRIETANTTVQQQNVNVVLEGLPADVRVIYWAAQPGKEVTEDPFVAYGDYSNAGYTRTNESGVAQFTVQCPSEYKVGISKIKYLQKQLKKHIHYRYELSDMKGMYSPVMTHYVEC